MQIEYFYHQCERMSMFITIFLMDDVLLNPVLPYFPYWGQIEIFSCSEL
jgi:hypothetical protein